MLAEWFKDFAKKLFCDEFNKSEYKHENPSAEPVIFFAALPLSPLLNCPLVRCDLRRVQWSKHHCKLTRQNSWWARSMLCVTALIAQATVGRWRTRVLISRQTALHTPTPHSTPLPPVRPTNASLTSQMNSGRDLLLGEVWLSLRRRGGRLNWLVCSVSGVRDVSELTR